MPVKTKLPAVLTWPIVQLPGVGAVLASNQCMYAVAQRRALALAFCAKVCVQAHLI